MAPDERRDPPVSNGCRVVVVRMLRVGRSFCPSTRRIGRGRSSACSRQGGATEIHWSKRPPDADYVILADPEGNRFCVLDAGSPHVERAADA